MNKEMFYKNMQPYIDLGMVREIHSTEHFTIISLGERVYSVCPHVLAENNYTVGIYMDSKAIKNLMKKDKEIYSVINVIFNNMQKNRNLLMHFSLDQINFWRKWIEDTKNINEMDYELEEKLSEINNKKRK